MNNQLSVWKCGIASAAFVSLALVATSCSDRARKETKEAADAVATDARTGADKAAEKTREAGREIAATAGEAGRDISAGAEKAADKTRAVAQDVSEAAAEAAQAGSDSWITTKVKAKFLDESILKGSDINVDTANHAVTLKGTVPSAAGRARAETIARGTDGVTRVINQLVVKP